MARTPSPESGSTGSDEKDITLALLALVLTPGLGNRTAHRVLSALGGWRRVRHLRALGSGDLERMGITPGLAREVLAIEWRERAEQEWERARESGVRILGIGHPDYPPLLVETSDAPLVLYVRGNAWDPRRPHVAIVGARGASPYGLQHAGKLARELASRGAIVVSGLARGIDTAAHEGALAAASPDARGGTGIQTGIQKRGSTVAVLGTGVDICYPAENRPLAESIASAGALVSEFAFGTPPLPPHFPLRNRIIAGMTWGTVVVEARERSGSLITARLAADANREVFAVPGPLDSDRSRGTHQLIRSGACLVTSADEVIAEFGPHVRNEFADAHQTGERSSEVRSCLSPAESKVMNALSTWEATPIDRLIEGVGLSPDKVYAALTNLELRGLIDTLPGDRYVRKGCSG
jgi:DNA processing protein